MNEREIHGILVNREDRNMLNLYIGLLLLFFKLANNKFRSYIIIPNKANKKDNKVII